jgi:hypothetical protein
MSEYDPLIARPEESTADDLERVRERFGQARRAYLDSPLPWLVWALVLPGAALATPFAVAAGGGPAVLLLWSAAVLLGGAVEGGIILRRRGRNATPLGAWVMRVQGNQSIIGLTLSLYLLWHDLAAALPGLWLLLIGHSFFTLGGLAFRPMRQAGVVYQLGGLLALWPGVAALELFAAATALGNLWIAAGLLRAGRRRDVASTGF